MSSTRNGRVNVDSRRLRGCIWGLPIRDRPGFWRGRQDSSAGRASVRVRTQVAARGRDWCGTYREDCRTAPQDQGQLIDGDDPGSTGLATLGGMPLECPASEIAGPKALSKGWE